MHIFRNSLIGLCLALTSSMSASFATAQEANSGPSQVDAVLVLFEFKAACVDTLPDYTGAESKLGSKFRQHPDTGTLYHSELDLSVRFLENDTHQRCSMVFSSTDDAMPMAIMLGGIVDPEGKSGDTLQIDPESGEAVRVFPNDVVFEFNLGTHDGQRQYYRAVITARK